LSVFLTVVLRSDSIRPVSTEERMRKTATLNLRVSPEFKRRLTVEAKKEKRSVTNYLEVTLANLWKQEASSKKRVSKVSEKDSSS
jgi:predicted HicB family RNase H-like nuclease